MSSLYLLNFQDKWEDVYFESSSGKTKQFTSFCRGFKTALKKDILEYPSLKIVEINNCHFEISGFLKNGKTNQYIYFRIGDVRLYGQLGKILIRTAESDKDFTGGHNNFCPLCEMLDKALTL